jgi:hypothetical protein
MRQVFPFIADVFNSLFSFPLLPCPVCPQNGIVSLSCVSTHAPLLRSLADPCAAACLRVLAHSMARDGAEITSCDVEVRHAAAAAATASNRFFQCAIAHCHASQPPLQQLRLAPALQTILHHACVHGLRMWLSSIPLPLLPCAACVGEPAAPPLPAWYAAAVAAMDNDTAKQVLIAAAAAAAAAAAGLVGRSDAALTPPCAASAVRWYVRILPTLFSQCFQLSLIAAPSPTPRRKQVRCSALSVAGCGAGCLGECCSG